MKKRVSFEETKICIPTSSGGHLTHMMLLKPFWENHDRFWVTFNKIDAQSQLKDEKNIGVIILLMVIIGIFLGISF